MRVLLTALAVLIAAPALAHDFTLGDLTIDHPWAPPSIAGQDQAAAYFVIRNAGDAPDRLIAVRTDAAARAELHGHQVVEGPEHVGTALRTVMRMTPIAEVEVPAHGASALAPGGLHVMLFDLAAPLALDDRLTLTLVFERAGEVEVEAHVESLARHLTAPEETAADAPAHEAH
jgi:copper(I)-binding protein